MSHSSPKKEHASQWAWPLSRPGPAPGVLELLGAAGKLHVQIRGSESRQQGETGSLLTPGATKHRESPKTRHLSKAVADAGGRRRGKMWVVAAIRTICL